MPDVHGPRDRTDRTGEGLLGRAPAGYAALLDAASWSTVRASGDADRAERAGARPPRDGDPTLDLAADIGERHVSAQLLIEVLSSTPASAAPVEEARALVRLLEASTLSPSDPSVPTSVSLSATSSSRRDD